MDEVTRCYQLLGLKAGSTESQIKQAYRDLVKVWHPDRFSHDERLRLVAQEKLKEINGAYEFLLAQLLQDEGSKAGAFSSSETEEAAEGASTTEDIPTTRNRYTLWAICGVVTVVILFAGWFVFRGKSSGKPASTVEPVADQKVINGLSPEEAKEGFESLFDGKFTEDWRGFRHKTFPDKAWVVEDGTLKSIAGKESVDLVTKDEYENFELRLEWRISQGGNSGILFHVSEEFPEAHNTGPEMQVLDDSEHKDGKNPKTSAGSLYGLIAPGNKQLKPVGDWNAVRMIVNGKHAEYWLNGAKVVEYELGSEALNALIAESKFKDMPRFAREKTGHIGLQHHHDEVWYRSIRVRRL
ncbi:MAG: hypothetical protein JWQ71_2074 [Pedosphaera sp.]|nr:hypothetical protein [Pedosphaera sp.]